MSFVVLTITFFSYAATARMTVQSEIIDMQTCQDLAARWAMNRDGLLTVLSTRCDPVPAAQVPSALSG